MATKTFVPARTPMRFPLANGENVSQIEFYDRLTDEGHDLSDIAAVIEPVIMAAQIEPVELSDVISTILST